MQSYGIINLIVLTFLLYKALKCVSIFMKIAKATTP